MDPHETMHGFWAKALDSTVPPGQNRAHRKSVAAGTSRV